MANMYYEKDCDLGKLDGKKIAIVGYGSQGHAHALNLKESGCEVCVALREGSKNWAKAEAAGLTVMTTAEAAKVADMIMILINDEKQADMYNKDIMAMSIDKVFDEWKLNQRTLLNPNSQGQPAFNIELTAQHEATWQAGDIAEVRPGNSTERLESFIEKHQINPNALVESLQIKINDALRFKNLDVDVEPFANLDHLLERLDD